jgi:hypothetical protein
MSTYVGRAVQKEHAPKVTEPAPVPEPTPAPEPEEAEKTRAELVEEAEALGIKIPSRASKAQIQKLIDEAPVM